MKRYITLLLVLAVCIPLMLQGAVPVSAATGEAISLMSYNICATGVPGESVSSYQMISNRYKNVLNVMYMPDGTEPDIICLQEVNNTWGQYLIDGLVTARGYTAYGFSSYGISSMTRGTGQWDLFNMIFYKTDKYKVAARGKFWCSLLPSTSGSVYDGGDFARCINYLKLQSKETGRQFYVVSAHIDAKSESVRNKSAEQIAKTMNEMAGGLPIIMMGDWNSKTSSSPYNKITGNGFNDARSIASSSSGSKTYVGFTGGSSSLIDHCFLSKNHFTVSQYKTITTRNNSGNYPSDHLPITIKATITTVAPSPTPIPTAKPTATPKPTASPTPKPTTVPTASPVPDVTDIFELDPSSTYTRDDVNKVIKGVKKNTSADDFLINFSNLDLLIKKNGNEIYGTTLVGTGTVITDGETEYSVVIKGDVNGDGLINTTDYLLIKRNISNNTLNSVKYMAADINGDDSLSTTDYLRVKRNIAGNYEL